MRPPYDLGRLAGPAAPLSHCSLYFCSKFTVQLGGKLFSSFPFVRWSPVSSCCPELPDTPPRPGLTFSPLCTLSAPQRVLAALPGWLQCVLLFCVSLSIPRKDEGRVVTGCKFQLNLQLVEVWASVSHDRLFCKGDSQRSVRSHTFMTDLLFQDAWSKCWEVCVRYKEGENACQICFRSSEPTQTWGQVFMCIHMS